MQITNISKETVVLTWGGQDYEIAPGMVVDIEKGIAAQFIDRRPDALQRFEAPLSAPVPIDQAVAAEAEKLPVEDEPKYDALTCIICAFKAKNDFGLRSHMRKHKEYQRKP